MKKTRQCLFKKYSKHFLLKFEKKRFISAIFWLIFVIGTVLLIALSFNLNSPINIRTDWLQDGRITIVEKGYKNIKAEYGGFRVYSFTMAMGMFFAILASYFKFQTYKLSVVDLSIGVIIIIPISLMGASFFGKLNASADEQGIKSMAYFFSLFAFWQAGMAIHGGVFAGTTVGLIVFYFIGRKSKTSLWVYTDCIVPNILLGQAIGRWGNFFNHEVTGSPVAIIAKAGTFDASLSDATIDNLFNMFRESHNGRSPISWIPDIILKNVLATDAEGNLVQLAPIFLYESVALLFAWIVITFVVPKIGKWFSAKPWIIQPEKYQLENFNIKGNIIKNTLNFPRRISSKNKIWKDAYAQTATAEQLQELRKTSTKSFSKRQLLEKINNPYGYNKTRVGVEFFSYFFAWNIVRYLLELDRPNDHLFIMRNKDLSLIIIFTSALIGIIGIIYCQYFAWRLFRKAGYLYEKPYLTNLRIKEYGLK